MATPRPTDAATRAARSNGRLAVICASIVFGMLGLAFASVPFYSWFCKVTGYDGTPGVASIAPDRVIDRKFTIRLDANVFAGLPWSFRPTVPSVELKAGEVATVTYRIENLSDQETRGIAAFNVTPSLAGGYFNKLACFCFTEQTLKPHEVLEAPVTFFVDPAIDGDKNLVGLAGITLSYTFFTVEKPTARAATAAAITSAPARIQN